MCIVTISGSSRINAHISVNPDIQQCQASYVNFFTVEPWVAKPSLSPVTQFCVISNANTYWHLLSPTLERSPPNSTSNQWVFAMLSFSFLLLLPPLFLYVHIHFSLALGFPSPRLLPFNRVLIHTCNLISLIQCEGRKYPGPREMISLLSKSDNYQKCLSQSLLGMEIVFNA